MKSKPFKLFALLSLLLLSCSPYKYKLKYRTDHIVFKNYAKIDTIYVENFVLCNNLSRISINENIAINEDSVIAIFSNSIQLLNLPHFVNLKDNLCDSEMHANRLLKLNKIDKYKIICNSNSRDRLVMVPVLYIDNMSMKHLYVTSSGVPGGGEFLRDTFLKIAIYLVKNNEIIYLKSARYGPVSSETATFDEDPPNKLEQEHWDKLVELVMSDYVKRLK